MDITALKELLTLGWPAIVTIMVVVLWKRNNDMTDRYIKFLEECINQSECRYYGDLEFTSRQPHINKAD